MYQFYQLSSSTAKIHQTNSQIIVINTIFISKIIIGIVWMKEEVKSDQKMQNLLRQFEIVHPKRKCQRSSGNQVTHMCINAKCQKSALICQQDSCSQCSKNHINCRLVNFKSITFYLRNKADGQRQFLLNLLKKLQGFITEIQRSTKTLIESLFLKDLQDSYFDVVEALYFKEKENYQIKGAFAKDFFEVLEMTSQEVIQDKPKLIQNIREQVNKISNSLKDLQNRMIEQFTNQSLKRELTILQNSKIIPKQNMEQRRFIDEALNKPKKLELVFRASENGFDASKFHIVCNNMPHTFTLVRTQFGKTFAGYTPITWNSAGNGIYSKDQKFKSFLLSIDLKQKMSLVYPNNAILCHQNYGPTFGGGYDFHISNKCNQNNSSYAKFPFSYNGSKVYQQNQATYSAFSGAQNGTNFKVTQYQVYKVIWQ